MIRDRPTGAWGLHLHGLGAAKGVLEEAAGLLYEANSLPTLTIEFLEFTGPQPAMELSQEHALLTFEAGGFVLVRRDGLSATYHLPAPIGAEALVHPYLAGPVAIVSTWLGRQVLHAGAIHNEGLVVALAGDREAGKSTLLSVLGDRGLPVLTDDLLVMSEGWAFPGPRCVDLRSGASAHLSRGRDLGILGNRERHRSNNSVAAPPEGGPLSRIVFLEWGDRLGLERVPAAERLPRLLAQTTVRAEVALPDPMAMLALARLSVECLTRPGDWVFLQASADLLLAGPL